MIFSLENACKPLLDKYDKIMMLKLYVDDVHDPELLNKYVESANKHNSKVLDNKSNFIDAGFDLFTPKTNDSVEMRHYPTERRFFGPGWDNISPVNKLDFNICCSARIMCDSGKIFNTGYSLEPRSSISKTKLRLANSRGIIDAGYRGHLIGMFDVVNRHPKEDIIDADFIGNAYDRYVQICAPSFVPILVEIVNSKEELGELTERGDGGFGSTGA